MKNIFKAAVAVSMIAILLFVFAGCGQQSTEKKVIMATNAEFPPFEFVSSTGNGINGEFDGIDVAIADEIAKDLSASLEVSNMDFNSIIPAVESGKADFGIAGMTVTEDRLENVDFSEPYWVAVQTIIVKEENTDITNVETLKGKKVGVVTGYTGDLSLSDIEGINLSRYQNGIDAVQDLKNGKIDAAVIDSPTASSFIAKNAELKGVTDDSFFETEEYAVAVKKGNKELLDKINATIKRLKDAGEVSKIAEEVETRLAQ